MGIDLNRFMSADCFDTGGLYTNEEVRLLKQDSRWPIPAGTISMGNAIAVGSVSTSAYPVKTYSFSNRTLKSISASTSGSILLVYEDGEMNVVANTTVTESFFSGMRDRLWQSVAGNVTANTILAIDTNGALWAYGSNANYLTAQATSTGSLTTMTRCTAGVAADSDWICVANTLNANAAVKSNGTLWTWGAATFGLTGQGATSGTLAVPTQVGTDTDWVEVQGTVNSGGGNNVFVARKANGAVYTWGNNSGGTTGLGLTTGSTSVPTRVGTGFYSMINAGYSTIMGIQTDGSLWSWGAASGSFMGSGNVQQTTPRRFGTDNDWRFCFTGGTSIQFHFAQKTNGDIYGAGSGTRMPRSMSSTTLSGVRVISSFAPLKQMFATQNMTFFSY